MNYPDLVNVHIYPSPFKYESRILKITKTLKEANVFNKIYIFATWETELPEIEVLDKTREVIRIKRKLGETKSGTFWKALKTFEWSWRVLNVLRHKKVDCINCHSLSMLPMCVFLKFVKRAKLIYDTHELETETAGLAGFRKLLSQIVERVLILFVDEIIAVNDSIAEWYQQAYGLSKVWVVKNVPYKHEVTPEKTKLLRDAFGIREDEILFLYQGIIGYGRGINQLLKVFSTANSNMHIVFLGYGELGERVKNYAGQYTNIHYHPAVKPQEVIHYTMSADIGLSFIENVCLSYYLCLPNKIFEYINCGLPVIVSDFPNLARFVDEHECGWKVSVEENAIKTIINSITKNIIYEKRVKALCAKEHYGWHLEEPILLSVYRRLGF